MTKHFFWIAVIERATSNPWWPAVSAYVLEAMGMLYLIVAPCK